MFIINNKTGEVIKVANSNNTGIAYDRWENGLYLHNYRETTSTKIDEDLIPSIGMSINQLRDKLSNDILLQELTGFVYSSDTRNWCIKKGSTGQPTTVRVYLPTILDKKARAARNDTTSDYYPLYLILKYVEELLPAETAIPSEWGTMQYLEDLIPEHREILSNPLYLEQGLIIDDFYVEEKQIEEEPINNNL